MDTIQNPEVFKGIVRPLTEDDFDDIEPILRAWIRDRITGEELPQEVADDLKDMKDSLIGENKYRYIVAVNEEGKVIGVVGIRKPTEKMQPYITTLNPAELINFYVSPEYNTSKSGKSKGVGRAMVSILESLAKYMGHTEIILNSGPRYANSAWGFYDKVFGERVALAVGMYKDENGQGGDAPIWRKLL